MAVAIIDSDTYESGSGGYLTTHTLPDIDVSGTDTLAIGVGFNRNPLSDVSSWTFEGNTPTSIINAINTNVAAIQSYRYLINNAATTIVSNTPSYKLQAMIGLGLSGVDQTTPIAGSSAAASGYSAAASHSYTGTSGNLLLVFVSTSADRTMTATNCTVLRQVTHADANLGSGFVGYVTATGSSQTVGATWTTDTNWECAVVEVKAASAAAGSSKLTLLGVG
jgi:hypothetical protein